MCAPPTSADTTQVGFSCWILAMVEPKSRVLDVGCGDGELLKLLEQPLQD